MEEKNIPTKDDSQKAPSEYVSELFENCVPMLAGMALLFVIVYSQKIIMPEYTEYNLSTLEVLGGLYILRMAHEIHKIRKNRKKGIKEENLHQKYKELYGLKYFSLYIVFTILLLVFVFTITNNSSQLRFGFLEYFGIFLLAEVGQALAQIVFALKEKHQSKEQVETK